jgi:hypothetical protein
MRPRLARPIDDIATGRRNRRPPKKAETVEAPSQGTTNRGVHFAFCRLCGGYIADTDLNRVRQWQQVHAAIHASKKGWTVR